MAERGAARRYAKSLLIVAEQLHLTESIETDLLTLKEVFQTDERFRNFFTSPLVPRGVKEDALDRSFAGRASPLLISFLRLLIRKRRFDIVPEIAEAFDDLADAYRGIVRIEVRSFGPLSEEARAKIEREVSRMLGNQKVESRVQVDRSLLGGLWVRLGDDLIDGSLAGRLKALRERLLPSLV